MTRSGRPLENTRVRIQGVEEIFTTDELGGFEASIPHGKINGAAQVEGQTLKFQLVNAPGLRRINVDLREEERPIEDERVREAMPSERYVPLKLLGKGAAGAVYKVRDMSLDRIVAVKLLNSDFATNDKERQQFLAEARNLARIEHPNLIGVYDIGFHKGRAYLVIQYIDGPDLETLLHVEGRVSPGAAAAAGVQLMRALDAIHGVGFVHRDVKPSNGLVDRSGRVKLADFGLVRPMIDFTDPRSKIFGTPAYMSPEQLQAGQLGPATDIYSLGASIYHMAAGQLPFNGKNPILQHLTEPPPDIRDVIPGAPEEFAYILQDMMAKEPEDRPDAREIVEVLMHLSTNVPHQEVSTYIPRLHTSDLSIVSGLARVGTGATPSVTRRTPGVRRSTSRVAGVADTVMTTAKGDANQVTTGSAVADSAGSSDEVDSAKRGMSPITMGALAAILIGGITAVVVATSTGGDQLENAPPTEEQIPPPLVEEVEAPDQDSDEAEGSAGEGDEAMANQAADLGVDASYLAMLGRNATEIGIGLRNDIEEAGEGIAAANARDPDPVVVTERDPEPEERRPERIEEPDPDPEPEESAAVDRDSDPERGSDPDSDGEEASAAVNGDESASASDVAGEPGSSTQTDTDPDPEPPALTTTEPSEPDPDPIPDPEPETDPEPEADPDPVAVEPDPEEEEEEEIRPPAPF